MAQKLSYENLTKEDQALVMKKIKDNSTKKNDCLLYPDPSGRPRIKYRGGS